MTMLAMAGGLEPVRTGHERPGDAALVIGIEDYFALPDVPHAHADAEAMAEAMVYQLGIPGGRVSRRIGKPSRQALERALTDLGASVGPDGRAWVYFAGHGAAHPSTGERMVMPANTPADTDGFAASGVSLEQIRAWAGAGGAEVTVLLDACYTGVGRSGDPVLEGGRFAVPSYAAPVGSSMTVWSAAGPDEVAWPAKGEGHGAFTLWFTRALQGWADGELDGAPDGVLTAAEVDAFVQRRVGDEGRGQHPRFEGASDDVLLRSERLEAEPEGRRGVTLPSLPSLPDVPLPQRDPSARASRVARVRTPARTRWLAALGPYSSIAVVRETSGWVQRWGGTLGGGLVWHDVLSQCARCSNGLDVDVQMGGLGLPLAFTATVGPRGGALRSLGVEGAIGPGLMSLQTERGDIEIHPVLAGIVALQWSAPKGPLWARAGALMGSMAPLDADPKATHWATRGAAVSIGLGR